MDFLASLPGQLPAMIVVVALLGWIVFFLGGGAMAVEMHLPRSRQFTDFRVTPWRAEASGGGTAGGRMTREAVLPLTFWTLRYRQVSDDGGVTVDTVRYGAEIRWGPTVVAMFVTALVPVAVYLGLRRAMPRDSAR